MPRMTREDAIDMCEKYGIERINMFPCQGTIQDWHSMTDDQKERVLAAAAFWGYKKPKNANGSKGRYFAEYLKRILENYR